MRHIPLWAMPFAVAASAFAGIIVVHRAFPKHTPFDWGLSLEHTALSGLVAAGIAAGRWASDRRVRLAQRSPRSDP